MKKLPLLLILLLSLGFIGSVSAECYYADDDWGNYGYYDEFGNECGPSLSGSGSSSSGGGGLSLLAILGLIFLGYIVWIFISGIFYKEVEPKPSSPPSSSSSQRKFVVNDVKDEVANQKELNNQLKNGEKHGKRYSYWPDGSIMTETNYIDEIIQNGKQIGYYLSGSKDYVENYKGGLRNGSSYSWYDGGQIRTKSHYINDKLERTATTWHENGQKRSEEYYVNGAQQEGSTYWDENGKTCTKDDIGFYDDIPF